MIESIEKSLKTLRQQKPVILNLTNYVTMDFMANCLLALGAAPIMSNCHEELEELIMIASAINMNLGTLDSAFVKQCTTAAELAKKYQKPIVLDPVGAGATQIRTQTATNLANYASVIKGNASEIMALGHASHHTKGVESANTTEESKKTAIEIANHYGCTVLVSGPVDFIVKDSTQTEVPYGSALMPFVTGMGCTLAAVIAAFSTVSDNAFVASSMSAHYFSLCAELAAQETSYVGSFRMHFINQLYAADFERMKSRLIEKTYAV